MSNHKFEYLFMDKDAYTTCLIQACADMYGLPPKTALVEDPEFDWSFLDWEPETMEAELTRDLAQRPPNEVLTKIQAGCGILISDAFHYNVHTFCAACQAMSRGIPMTEWFIPSGLKDTAWGVLEANMLEGPAFWKIGFGQDVSRYVGLILQNHGVYSPPAVLRFASGLEESKEKIRETIGDDPELFSSSVKRQGEAKDDLQGYLNDRTAEMLRQWMDLPIPYLNREGDAKKLLSIVA